MRFLVSRSPHRCKIFRGFLFDAKDVHTLILPLLLIALVAPDNRPHDMDKVEVFHKQCEHQNQLENDNLLPLFDPFSYRALFLVDYRKFFIRFALV